ncbi:MAG TPA: hypothetical protein VFP65_23800 [Anaeromyxobacteraceae bacterium]|nr:hypothetical protein [Anaeromyxobacteraceae bacterium]
MPDYPSRAVVLSALHAQSIVPLQLTIDGREEPCAAPERPRSSQSAPASLFDAGAFAPRVPGTLPMDGAA